MTIQSPYQEISIRKGETEMLELPPYPVQAPSFFRWKIEYGGGEFEIDVEEGILVVSGDKLGSHAISFVPATTKGRVLMSGRYTGCGEEHRVLVTVYQKG